MRSKLNNLTIKIKPHIAGKLISAAQKIFNSVLLIIFCEAPWKKGAHYRLSYYLTIFIFKGNTDAAINRLMNQITNYTKNPCRHIVWDAFKYQSHILVMTKRENFSNRISISSGSRRQFVRERH